MPLIAGKSPFEGVIGMVARIFLAVLIDVFIDDNTIKDTVRIKCPEALKALIQKKKKNAIDVGIFNKQDQHICSLEIKSSQGVSNSLHVGQVINL